MTPLVRAVIFALTCFGLISGYVAVRRAVHSSTSTPTANRSTFPREGLTDDVVTFGDVRGAPHLAYRSARAGEFGLVVLAALADPERRRIVTSARCERAHFDRSGGLCLTYDRDALEPNFRAVLVDAFFVPYRTVPMAGYPSRSSLSRDGKYAASTVFTTGDSYDSEFSTRTTIMERASGDLLPDLERFTVTKDGQPFKHVDFNFWGITFAPNSDTFFATLGTNGSAYLVEGNVTARTLTVVRDNVECPALSPNGKVIAFKRRNAETKASQLYTLDTQTWKEAPIPGESRHIDDQATWLDDLHLLYGVTTSGAPEDALNVWVASIVQSDTAPRVFIRGASSPSVIR